MARCLEPPTPRLTPRIGRVVGKVTAGPAVADQCWQQAGSERYDASQGVDNVSVEHSDDSCKTSNGRKASRLPHLVSRSPTLPPQLPTPPHESSLSSLSGCASPLPLSGCATLCSAASSAAPILSLTRELSIIFLITRLIFVPRLSNPALGAFVKTMLLRSKVSISVFRISILYLFYYATRLKGTRGCLKKGFCIRRCWLSCLILASKYHEDCNYSFKAWSKLSGLSVVELQSNELKVLDVLGYDLNVDLNVFHYLFGSFSNSNPTFSLNGSEKPATCTLRVTLARLLNRLNEGQTLATSLGRKRRTSDEQGTAKRTKVSLVSAAS
ncbi:DEKNAAC102909 [Brettanomyces naardenensis]|uniref:DEKNAAC102909 n=1 Tax=Brettanomyces naardenensis TaxID=13370 RepID=A0A448YM15_BRENA|nr:DEKNAAC102909 [Brettanomyces naardenensis]